ncbi:MAG: sugar ABC transporter ATP-binding protein [Lachnospirales bacterium]
MNNLLEFKNISKFFPGVKALDNISFKAYGGEVLAFLGENGAGKSTLLKTLNGDYKPDQGEYLLNGEVKYFKAPTEAIDEGISVIYQERQILLELSVAENIFLGRMPSKFLGIIDTAKANDMAREVINSFGLQIDPETKVKDLNVAYQQMVEIMKAYSRDNLKVICFDEPTASLSDSEIESLFNIIKKLKSEGKVIIYVTHRMNEIKTISDKVAIFKDGCYIDTLDSKTANEDTLIEMMSGRNLGDIFGSLERNSNIGDILLEVKNLSSDYVKPCSFTLRKGEVLGFSGLVGAGRTELMRAIIGADKIRSGEIYLEGKKIVNKSPKEASNNDIVLVPEDRKLQGILSNLNVKDNINISMLDKNSNSFGVVNTKKEDEIAKKGIEDFKIKTPTYDKKIIELSGGNQQKCIVARWLTTEPKVLILDEPTKGIDIGAKSEFYNMICNFAKKGLGVILVSSELTEVIGLSDRILVMKSLEIVGEIAREDANETNVLKLGMLGGSTGE